MWPMACSRGQHARVGEEADLSTVLVRPRAAGSRTSARARGATLSAAHRCGGRLPAFKNMEGIAQLLIDIEMKICSSGSALPYFFRTCQLISRWTFARRRRSHFLLSTWFGDTVPGQV